MDIKETISNFVANAKLDQALEEFIKWADENNKDLNNQLLLTKGRLNALKRQENLGLIGFSEAARDRAQIANTIMEMTSQIEESSPNNSDSSSPLSTSRGNTSSNSGNIITTNDTILFLASNPVDTSELDLNEEFVKIHSKLQNSKYKLNSAWAVTADSLQDALLNYEPRILHFSGHGSGSGGSAGGAGTRAIGRVTKNAAGIYVKNEENGTKQMISGKALAGLFKVCRKIFNLEVVLLNACHSKEQAEAIFAAGVPFVIGMNTAVYDETAIEFAASFYRGMSKRGNVEIAFELAVASIELNDLKGIDTPVLYKK
jgi:hypothetical protein